MKKIAVAITGASGSIYAKLFLQKLDQLKSQIVELSVVMTENAKQVTIRGRIALLTHGKSRSLLASIGNAGEASQFIELKLPPSPQGR